MAVLSTVICCCEAPAGTVTVSEVVVAAETVARTAPKYTILLPGDVLKLLPVMVTGVPTGPLEGLKLLIRGTWAEEITGRVSKAMPSLIDAFVKNIDAGGGYGLIKKTGNNTYPLAGSRL